MPGLQCSYGDVTRLDVSMPFFLRDVAFTDFKSEKYTWEPSTSITVLVKTLKKSHPNKAPTRSPSSGGTMSESIGGCPLECPFDPNENFAETLTPVGPPPIFPGLDFALDQYEAMDLPTCRGLVKKIYEGDESTVQSLCLDRVAGKQTASSPIYVACDGSPNAKDLVMIGFNDEKFLELRMMGPYKRQSTQLNLELFLAYHQHLPNVNPASIYRQVHAVYEKIHGEHPSDGKVFMEFLWNDPKVLFESPPSTINKAKVAIQPKPGDANPFLRKLWEEVNVLDKLLEMLEVSKADDLDRTQLSMSMAMSNSPLIEDMKFLLSQHSTPSWKKAGGQCSDSMDDALRRVVDVDRHDADFVDKVWQILRSVTSWQELIECFHTMFKAVEDKQFRPFLLPSNTTLLCGLLRGVMTGEISNYRAKLNPAMVIEVTLDCGLNKLYKDYAFVLAICQLADHQETKKFLPQPRLYRESLNSIKKLQCIVEILCLSRERLVLSTAELGAQTKKLLEYFTKNPLDWEKTFHFDIAMSTIATVLNGLHPVYWNLKLESSSTLRVARTNAILARDFFIGHAKKFYVTAEGIVPRGYYLYVHRIAQRKM